jgi:hypothetical protein
LYDVQAAAGVLSPEIMEKRFGEHVTERLHTQMSLAHHHVFVGKFTESAHPRPSLRHRGCLKRSTALGPA